MDTNEQQVYLILGTPGSKREDLVFDLIDGSLKIPGGNLILLNEHDSWQSKTDKLEDVRLSNWGMVDHNPITTESTEERIFYIADGRDGLADQVEAFKAWLEDNNLKLTRIISTLDMSLIHEHDTDLWPYVEALAHFSDYIVLTNYEKLPNKYIDDFFKRFEKGFFPCIVERFRKNRVENPMLVLDSLARRITTIFDEFDPLDDMDFDEENLPEEPFDIEAKPDPYLEKYETGERMKLIPDISKYLK